MSQSENRPESVSNPFVYRILLWFVSAVMHLAYRYRATGRENVPLTGPVMIVVNHLFLLDPGAVAPAVPRQVTTLAADKWRKHGLVRAFLRGAGTIFVTRGEVDRHALSACFQVLKHGYALAIAPEGTRSKTGGLQQAKSGVAYIASRADVPILPVGFWGLEKLGDWKRFKRPTCQVVIGRPFKLPESEGRPSAERLQELADLIMLRIGLLIPESYRGVYRERIAAVETGESRELDQLQQL